MKDRMIMAVTQVLDDEIGGAGLCDMSYIHEYVNGIFESCGEAGKDEIIGTLDLLKKKTIEKWEAFQRGDEFWEVT